MAYQPVLEFASFHCRFGEDETLVDYLEEIVLPAFDERSEFRRMYGDNRYLILDSDVVILEDGSEPVVGLAGRLIKDTIIHSQQVYDEENGLRPDNQKLKTAPSSSFVLLLNTHTLLYLEEMQNAPNLREFRASLGYFLRESRLTYTRSIYEKSQSNQEGIPRIKLKTLREQIARPTLEVVPMASAENLRTSLDLFTRLTTFNIQFINTNDTVHDDGFFDAVQARKERIAADKTTLSHHSSAGLNKDVAYEDLIPLSGRGNATFTLLGKDNEGARLSGGEDRLKLRVPISRLPERFSERIQLMYRLFRIHVDAGTIHTGETPIEMAAKIQQLCQKIRENDGE